MFRYTELPSGDRMAGYTELLSGDRVTRTYVAMLGPMLLGSKRRKLCRKEGNSTYAYAVPFPRVWNRLIGSTDAVVSPLGPDVASDKVSQWWAHPAALVGDLPLSEDALEQRRKVGVLGESLTLRGMRASLSNFDDAIAHSFRHKDGWVSLPAEVKSG